MTSARSNNHDTARVGRELVAAFLRAKKVDVQEERDGNRVLLLARLSSNRTSWLIIKTRRSGDWQPSTNEGDPELARENTFWVFVDLTTLPKPPEFYVAPDEWIRKDIQQTHRAYLDRNEGERVRTPDSTHHRITEDRIAQWKNRWDLLGLNI